MQIRTAPGVAKRDGLTLLYGTITIRVEGDRPVKVYKASQIPLNYQKFDYREPRATTW